MLVSQILYSRELANRIVCQRVSSPLFLSSLHKEMQFFRGIPCPRDENLYSHEMYLRIYFKIQPRCGTRDPEERKKKKKV